MTTRSRSKLKRTAIAVLLAFPAWAASGGGPRRRAGSSTRRGPARHTRNRRACV